MDEYGVIVEQGDNVVKFAFNRMSDAMKFAADCFEVGDEGTKVTMYYKNNKEE